MRAHDQLGPERFEPVGYGNHCDGDLNDNGVTNADFNANGFVNSQDFVLFRQLLGLPPGPSGLVP